MLDAWDAADCGLINYHIVARLQQSKAHRLFSHDCREASTIFSTFHSSRVFYNKITDNIVLINIKLINKTKTNKFKYFM